MLRDDQDAGAPAGPLSSAICTVPARDGRPERS